MKLRLIFPSLTLVLAFIEPFANTVDLGDREELRTLILREIQSMASDLISERGVLATKQPRNNPSYGEKDYLHYTLARQKRSSGSQEYSPSDQLVLLDEIMSVAGQTKAHEQSDTYLFQNLLLKAFDQGQEQFTDGELKEVFQEYFSVINPRRKRSILNHPTDPLLADNVEITFPLSDRAQGAKPKVNLIGKHGEVLDDPDAVILTQADIQEITKKSSLAQILEWLEDLSKGRERNVTVLATKDNRAEDQKAKDENQNIESETFRPKALRSSIEREKIESEENLSTITEGPVVKETIQKHVHRSHQHKHKHHAKHHHQHHQNHKEVLTEEDNSKDPLN